MPTLFDLHGIGALDDGEPAPVRPSGSEFGRGFKRSFAELPGLAAGAGAYVADVAGARSARDAMLGYSQRRQEEVERNYGSDAASFSNVLEGKADLGDFLANVAGYVTGQAAQAIASGGLTALGFRTLAKKAATEAAQAAAQKAAALGATEALALEAGKDAARDVLTRSMITGGTVGAGAHNLGMELGSIYPEAVDEAQKEGRELDGGDKIRVGLSALAAAAVDTAMERLTAGKLLKGSEGSTVLARARREVPLGMAREASTEAVQTGIERFGAGQEIASPEGMRAVVDAAAVGAVGGGLAGGAASVRRAQTGTSLAPTDGADAEPAALQASQRSASDDGLRVIAEATSVGEAIAGARQAADVPLTGGLTAEQEARALTALDAQAQTDIANVRNAGRAMTLAQQRASGAPPAPAPAPIPEPVVTDAPFADRVLMLREQVADPAVRDKVRQAFGPDALREALRAVSVADRPDIDLPEVTREKLLQAAELIVSRAIAQPLAGAARGPSATRLPAGPALQQPPRRPRLTLDTAPTGVMRVDSAGAAAPEVRADVISTKQRVDAMRRRPDGMTQQVQGRPLPRDFTLVGDGTLTTPSRPAPAAPRQIAMDTPLDERAHAAATSPTNDRPEPTQAQKEAGNYAKGHIRVAGLDISVENPAGSTRSGVDADGKAWQNQLAHHYGYIRRTTGADGEHVDTFVKPGTPENYSGNVFIVDQIDPATGKFDEHKVVIGAADRADAEAIYRANYAADWKGLKAIKGMTMPAFKKWLAGDTTKPVGTTKDRVDAMRKPPAPPPADPNALPTEKLAELVQLTGRDRGEVARQFAGIVNKQGRAKADEMLDRALQVARARPKPAPAPEPAPTKDEGAAAQPAVAAPVEQSAPPASSPVAAAPAPQPQPEPEGEAAAATEAAAPQKPSRGPAASEAGVPPRAKENETARVREQVLQQEVDLGLERIRELRTQGALSASEAMAVLEEVRGAPDAEDASRRLRAALDEHDASKAKADDRERDAAERESDTAADQQAEAPAGPEEIGLLGNRSEALRAVLESMSQGISLTTAIRRLGGGVSSLEDRRAIMERAAALRRGGKPASEAGRQAVDEQLAALREQIAAAQPTLAERVEATRKRPASKPDAAGIQDAGEKIGGARKDRWKERGLSVEDLDEMAEGEGATLATKANVWKPDYAAIAEQSEPVAAAMVKVVYDSLAAKPRKNTPEGRRDYVRAMQAVRKVYGAVRSMQDAKDAHRALHAELGVQPNAGLRALDPKSPEAAARRVLFSVYKGRSDPFVFGFSELQRAKALVQEGFPGAIEPWTRRFAIRERGGAGLTERGAELALAEAAAAGTPLSPAQIRSGYFEVRDKAGRVLAYLPAQADAEQAARALYEQAKAQSDKVAPDRPHLDKIVREGLDQAIDRDVTAQDLLDTFGFRGIEWGNWSAQDERQRLLNLAFDALADLAEVMNVPRKALSLNGTLGMAFGARGGGNFAAHYEPGKLVINMTKLRGAGSLAHEWAHALDHYLGELDRADAYQGSARGVSGWHGQRAYTGRDAPKNLRPELARTIDTVMQRLYEGTVTKDQMLAELQAQLERTKAMASGEQDARLAKLYADSIPQQQARIDEVKAAPNGTTYPRGRSDFSKEAQKLSGKSADGYWLRPTEMWARAFESYVFDRLVAMGAKSEYLVHGVEQDRFADGARFKGNPYPTGAERAAINAAFDAFTQQLKTRETDKGTALFSRAGPFVAIGQLDGMPIFTNVQAGIVLGFPQETARLEVIEGEGEQVVNYAVMPADGFDVLGHVVLLLKDGQPASLIDIEVYGQRAGVGRKVIETLLAANPGADLNISNVVPAARGFWAKMGVPEQNVEAGAAYDGTLNWQTYAAAAGDGRAEGGDPKGSRGARPEPDTGATQGPRGLREAGQGAGGEAQGLTQAEAAAILALPQDLINRLLGRRPTVERLRELVTDAAPGLDVAVVQSVADLPPEQRKKLSAIDPGSNIRGVYFPDDDRVWLIADHLHSEAEATFVLLHEAFHRGLAKTIGGDAKRVLRQMYHTNGRLQQLAKQQMKLHGIELDEAIEEALADLAGKGEARGLRGWQRLVEMIRSWLAGIGRALGLDGITWSDEMIEDFVAGTAQAGLRGEPHTNPAAGAAISAAGHHQQPAARASRATDAPPIERSEGPVAAQDLINASGGAFDFNRLGATKQDRIRTVVDGSRPFWLGALTRDQIADIYGQELPPVKEYDRLTRSMENERSKIAQDADALYKKWSDVDSEANDRLARVMLDATVHSVHPDGDFTVIAGNDAATEAERRKMHKRLRREFAELPAEAQAVYREVRDFHAGMLEQLRTGLEERIQRQVQDGKARAAALTGIRQSFERYQEHGPYFPLSRFGEFLVIGTRADGKRVVASYETAGEQATAARALRADGFTVKTKTAKQYTRAMDGSAGRFAGDVLTMLNDLDVSEATVAGKAADLKSKLMDDVNQLFIRALPDLSYRKHFAHRKNTPGFSSDMMRGFASSAFHAASHIARLNHADQMSFALEDAFKAIDRADDGDFNRHTQVLNELALRHDASMNPNTHPIAAMLNQVGFVMYLGMSPAAGLVNLLQTPMVTLPYLGARHGFGKATAALGRATKDILGASSNRQNGWNAADSPKLTETERETIRKLQDEGVIDLTQAHDLSAATGLDTGNVAHSKAAFAMARAMKIVGWTFHVPEVMNRQATALAAYRLEMEASGDQAKAEDAAREAIKRTHFDYSASNRARYMQGNVARVMLQFKQYAQNMTYLLGRAAHQAMKGETAEVRSIARRQLVATLGMTFGMAGALGLPSVGAVAALIGMMVEGFDDDDKPWDWKVELRNALADSLGKEAGEVISHGIPRALMPWDLAGRVGMGDLWFRSNDREGQSPREAFANDMANILGPTAGTVLGLYTAADHMARGNWSKAAEAAVPKFVRDPLQAARIASEGVTSYKGEHLMDVSAAEVFGRAIGFTPARVSEMYEGRNAVQNAKTAVEERRSLLIARGAQARIDRDADELVEVQADIAEFNRRNPAERIKGEAIIASVLNRTKRQQVMEDGVVLSKSRDHLREAGRFAVTE